MIYVCTDTHVMMSSDLHGHVSSADEKVMSCTNSNLLSRHNCNPYIGRSVISFIDVCVDIYVMMSSDVFGTCSCLDIIVMSHTNSNLPYGDSADVIVTHLVT